ncbi:hypothetical protein [Acutalibacter sp. JLR.KK004]|uniref:5' nucleotidase, NT5C type n=1 Tax=Acutalibacter sp. JLR.KK004 TaxID=3112622 RepID=UPI002FF073A6
MKNIYINSVGVLAKPNLELESLEELFQPGYFANLAPEWSMIEAARLLAGQEGCQVYILAPAFPGPYAMEEQQAWLDRYLPEIPQENRLFVPLGQSKAQALGRPLTQEDVLVDGFSRNLPDWEKAGGVGIQSLKGVQIPARRDKHRQLEGVPHGALPLFLLPKGYSLLTKFDKPAKIQSV